MDIAKAHTKKESIIVGAKGWMIDAQWIHSRRQDKKWFDCKSYQRIVCHIRWWENPLSSNKLLMTDDSKVWNKTLSSQSEK